MTRFLHVISPCNLLQQALLQLHQPSQGPNPPTFGWLEFMSCFLKPASRMNVWGVSIQPEIMAFRVAIKMKAHPITTYLHMEKVRDCDILMNCMSFLPVNFPG